MIERSQRILLDALKASLFDIKPSYPDDTDWNEVVMEARAQTLTGLISPVIPIHDEISEQIIVNYMRILYEQDKLIRLFDGSDIPCVILKGCAAAVYYPKPYLRAMGDVDLLVPRDKFYEAVRLMESNGYVYTNGKGDDGNLEIEERHIGYVKNGIEFELHHHFSSPGFDMDDILEAAIEKREYRELNGYRFPMLPDAENGLVLLGHINQHLKDNTLGLRQIIDWEMFFYDVMNNEIWKNQFAPLAKETGLLQLAVNVTKLCEKQLGLTKTLKRKNKTEEDITDELLENILTSGNFGIKRTSSPSYAGDNIQTIISVIKRKGFYSYLQDNGLLAWELCKKYPVLKPFAFIYGFFRFLERGTKGVIRSGNIKKQLEYVEDKNDYNRKLGIKTVPERKRRVLTKKFL